MNDIIKAMVYGLANILVLVIFFVVFVVIAPVVFVIISTNLSNLVFN